MLSVCETRVCKRNKSARQSGGGARFALLQSPHERAIPSLLELQQSFCKGGPHEGIIHTS